MNSSLLSSGAASRDGHAKSIFRLLLALAFIVAVIGCKMNGADGSAISRIAWSSSPGSRSTLVSSPRATTGDSFITEHYATYGTRVAALTPTKFKLPLQAVELANADEYFNPIPFHQFDEDSQTWIMQYGDFSDTISVSPDGEVPHGTYSDFTIFFFSSPSEMGMSSTPGIYADSAPEVVLDLPPGYEEFVSEDEVYISQYTGTEVTTSGKTFYHSRIIDADRGIFQFSLDRLFPRNADGEIPMEVFCFTGDEYKVYAPGIDGVPETYDILDYKDTPGMGINGNNIFTKVPWNGVTISEDAYLVEFTFAWDLDGIIELYDNATPDNKSDDILVLADKFWERLSLSVVQYDEAGELIQ